MSKERFQELLTQVGSIGLTGQEAMATAKTLAKARGIEVPRELAFEVIPGEANKNERPGVLYLSTPSFVASDGKGARGLYLEVGAIDQAIEDLNRAKEMLITGDMEVPRGYEVGIDENDHLTVQGCLTPEALVKVRLAKATKDASRKDK